MGVERENMVRSRIQNKELVKIISVFMMSILYQVIFNYEGRNYWDASDYLHLAQMFFGEDGFSLKNFGGDIRGVWFPLLLSFLVNIDAIWGWRVFAACMTVYFVVFVPRILTNNREVSWKKILVLLTLLHIFWSGLFLYVLSDAVALMFFGLSVYFILFNEKPWGYLLGGGLLYITYNTRTIYLFPIIFIVGSLAIYKLIKKEKNIFAIMGMIIAGILIATIPQVAVNMNNYNIFSAKVVTTEDNDTYKNGLFAWQLAEGLRITEYIGYMGDEDVYPIGGVRFVDRVGERLYVREEINPKTITIKEIVKLWFKYPLDVIGIYMRHFINSLNPVWGEVYVGNLEKIKIYLTLINYIIIYIMLYWNVLQRKRRGKFRKILGDENKGKIYLTRLAFIVPYISMLPGAIETRFFFPMYIVLYVYLIYDIGISGLKEIWNKCKENYLISIASFVIGFFILCAIWGNTYSNINGNLWIGLL